MHDSSEGRVQMTVCKSGVTQSHSLWKLLAEQWMSNKLASNLLTSDSFLQCAVPISCRKKLLEDPGLSWQVSPLCSPSPLPQAPLPQPFSIHGVVLRLLESHKCNARKIENRMTAYSQQTQSSNRTRVPRASFCQPRDLG